MSNPHPEVKKKARKPKGRKGWGGAWRAFVRVKTLGSKGKPDFAKLSIEYNTEMAGDSETAKRCKQLGKAAAESGAACPPKADSSSFGPTGRQALLKRSRDIRESLRAAFGGKDKEAGALALGDRLVRMGAEMSTALTIARSALRVRTRHEKLSADELARKVKAFAEEDGKRHLDELRAQIPGLPTEGLTAIPAPSGLICVECAPSIGPMVAKAVAWSISSQETNGTAGMRSHWEQINRPIGEDGSPDPPAPKEKKDCRFAGMCLCSDEGKALNNLREKFIAATKKACPRKSDLREALVTGHIVAKLVGSPVDFESDEFLDLDEPTRTLFVHVGRVRLSPWRMFFLLLEQDKSATIQPTGNGFDHLRVSRFAPKVAISACASGFVFPRINTHTCAFHPLKCAYERDRMPDRSTIQSQMIRESGYACWSHGAFALPGGW